MTIYLVTYHEFNHVGAHRKPIDKRFLEGSGEYVYYLIDHALPKPLTHQEVLFEHQIDPQLHKAGGKYFGEWSFLLAEAKHSFCRYPLFMLSSRFYEKNLWLLNDLNREWKRLFGYLKEYGWGFLPSYNRPLRWADLYKSQGKNRKYFFSPFKPKFYEVASQIFQVNIPKIYRYVPDLFCHYIGFQSREHLLQYVNFYRPFFEYFFDGAYQPKVSLDHYVLPTGHFRNEKPFTFLIEALSHLFFYQSKNKMFALHYDGYYEIDEARRKKRKIYSFSLPPSLKWKRRVSWEWRKLHTEGILSPLKQRLKSVMAKKPLTHK